MTKRVVCIINEKSGKNATTKEEIEAVFEPYDIEFIFHEIKQGLGDAEAAIKETNPAMLIASGGDGTVNACAQLAVKFDLPLGVLPNGTLNHFAKDMKIPNNLEDAAKVIDAA